MMFFRKKEEMIKKNNKKDMGVDFITVARKHRPNIKLPKIEVDDAPVEPEMKWKFNEPNYFEELETFIKGTYKSHYANSKEGVQAFDLIESAGYGEGFAAGSIIKYAARYGKKDGYNRKDIMKILHYGMLLLHNHDFSKKDEENG